jgi:hypothetical protein
MKINDNINKIYTKFNRERLQSSLFTRYPGHYRALVVETNDPLNMHRIRFIMPEQHNFDLKDKPESCPWAVPAFPHGGKGAGAWYSPCIGDYVWIAFEKQHPYGPIWTGHAEPTRRRFYKLHALFHKSNVYVDEEGKPKDIDTIDWEDTYLSKDGRPYSQGLTDRYGNMFLMEMTGFYPKEHEKKASTAGSDVIKSTPQEYREQKEQPKKNNPDLKMMAMVSKYGHYFMIGDQGYDWKSEFDGDFEADHDKEKSRTSNIKKLLNENEPDSSNKDQRRVEIRTSYGHKFELRDVGWSSKKGWAAKSGKIESQSRPNDLFVDQKRQSLDDKLDERWIKLRTKGGMLLQFMDMGFNPKDDSFIKRSRVDEIGGKVDEEEDNWQDRDARQMRFITRWGVKFVLDDRGSDENQADTKESKHANGWLIKGRRKANWINFLNNADNEGLKSRVLSKTSNGSPAYTPKHGDIETELGFGVDVNEKNELNRMLLYTPMAKAIELNDRFGYVFLTTDMPKSISKPWMYKKENEFATAICMGCDDPESNTYSLKLDRSNTYNALSTPLDQCWEARDGFNPSLEGFMEARDMDNRALIMSKYLQLAALHDPTILKYLVLDDKTAFILLHNSQNKIQIYSSADVEIKSAANIRLDSASDTTIKCSKFIVNASGTEFVVDGQGFGSNNPMFAPESHAYHIGTMIGPGAGPNSPKSGTAPPITKEKTPNMIPAFRKNKSNGPYNDVSEEIIKGEEQI